MLTPAVASASLHHRTLAEQVFGKNFSKLVEIIRHGQARETLRHLPGVDFAGDALSYHRKMMQVMLNGLLPAIE